MKNLLCGRRRKAAPAGSQPSHTASDQALGPDLSNGTNGTDIAGVLPTVRFIGSTEANDKEADEKVDETYRALQDADRRNSARERRARRISRARSGPSGAVDADNLLGAAQGDAAIAQQYATAQSVKNVYDSEAMKTVRDGVNALVDSLPGLVKALDEVAKLHPFIGVAVGAFRVVIELNIKRQDNDRKISVLFVKMRDMMESLLQLRPIKKESRGSDGQSIEARLQRLVQEAADEVKNCANVCDTYAKKVVVKVIMATVWDTKLSSFIDIFVSRRRDIMYTLAIHTSKGIEDANRKLDKMDTKIDVLLEFFRTAVSPEQQELMALITRKGGAAAVMANDDALNDLIKFKSKSDSSTMKRGRDSGPGESEPTRGQRADRDGAKQNSHAGGDSLAAVKQELFDSPDVAIQKNLEVFERKFAMQRRELEAEMRRIVHHEGDRVIAAVNSGAHDRIIDPEIHEIWKEMRWPGHVKARHFVLALRDYYRQQIEKKRKAQKDMQWISHTSSRQLVLSIRDKVDDLTKRKGNEEMTRVSDQDEWALEYISINRLQALAEAFDDDASGFITVAEVNYFTSSRPKEWSLPHWLAYWAIGWQLTACRYRSQIVMLCEKMFAIRPLIRPENKFLIDRYLKSIWKLVNTLTSSLAYTYQPDSLDERFASYVEAEEKRLQEGLKTARFKIDARDTLSLITGPGRIEQHLMPLMYLLLKRHFEIFRLGRNLILNDEELQDAASSMKWLFDAVRERHDDLSALFIQQRLELPQQFKTFASELFEYWHDSSKFWSVENMRDRWGYEVEYADEEEDQNVDVDEILKYPSPTNRLYVSVEDVLGKSEVPAVRKILGRWNGYMGSSQWPAGPMMTFCVQPSALDPESYEANSETARGNKFSILGKFAQEDGGSTTYTFTITYAAGNFIFRKSAYFIGTISDDELTLSGTWGYEEEDRTWDFVFSRLPPEIVAARPAPHEYRENRIQALWTYARNASRNQVRVHSKSLPWSYIKHRRDTRNEYLALARQESISGGYITDEEFARFAALDRRLTYADVRCYYVLGSVARHCDASCDVCHEDIYGPRLVCMECGSRYTVDFCVNKPECYEQAVKTRDDLSTPHQPTHDMVKIRADIHYYRDIGRVLRTAKDALNRGRQMLAAAEVKTKDAAERVEEYDLDESASKSIGKGAARREDWFADPTNTKGGDGTPIPRCVTCGKVVSQPCWYCIDCPEEANAFECTECDMKATEEAKGIVRSSCSKCEKANLQHFKKLAVKVDKRLLRSAADNEDEDEDEASEEVSTCNHHRSDHNVVRCIEKKEGSGRPKTTEERLTSFEGQLTALTVQIARMEKALQSVAGVRAL